MKKILGIMMAISMTTTSFVGVSCGTKQKNLSYKETLGQLIEQIQNILDSISNKDSRFMQLESAVNHARFIYNDLKRKETDFIETLLNLNIELKEYKNPGYKEARKKLFNLVSIANEVIEREDNKNREPWLLLRLESEIIKANKLLDIEEAPHNLIIECKLLKYWISKYDSWEEK